MFVELSELLEKCPFPVIDVFLLYFYKIDSKTARPFTVNYSVLRDKLGVPFFEQVLPDRDGKRCMFCLKTLSKTYEMSASDTKQRQEWTTG